MTSLLGIALAASLAAPHSLPLSSASRPVTSQQPMIRFLGGHTFADRAADVQAMLQGLNARRTAAGLAPLTLDQSLSSIALDHAADMAVRSYFAHVTPEGVSPFGRMDRAHIPYGYAGENMAIDESARAAELALWLSPEHRDNILQSHFVKVGIAAISTNDGEIFVEDFTD